jgi:hypothetical protein
MPRPPAPRPPPAARSGCSASSSGRRRGRSERLAQVVAAQAPPERQAVAQGQRRPVAVAAELTREATPSLRVHRPRAASFAKRPRDVCAGGRTWPDSASSPDRRRNSPAPRRRRPAKSTSRHRRAISSPRRKPVNAAVGVDRDILLAGGGPDQAPDLLLDKDADVAGGPLWVGIGACDRTAKEPVDHARPPEDTVSNSTIRLAVELAIRPLLRLSASDGCQPSTSTSMLAPNGRSSHAGSRQADTINR